MDPRGVWSKIALSAPSAVGNGIPAYYRSSTVTGSPWSGTMPPAQTQRVFTSRISRRSRHLLRRWTESMVSSCQQRVWTTVKELPVLPCLVVHDPQEMVRRLFSTHRAHRVYNVYEQVLTKIQYYLDLHSWRYYYRYGQPSVRPFNTGRSYKI